MVPPGAFRSQSNVLLCISVLNPRARVRLHLRCVTMMMMIPHLGWSPCSMHREAMRSAVALFVCLLLFVCASFCKETVCALFLCTFFMQNVACVFDNMAIGMQLRVASLVHAHTHTHTHTVAQHAPPAS